MLSSSQAADLRRRLESADFTVDAVQALLGPAAQRAMARNETVAARRATSDGSPLATLVRLFSLQLPVERSRADAALPGLVDPMVAARMLEVSGDEVRALVDVRPYGDDDHDWWIVCDLTPGLDRSPRHVTDDHVLGISEASSSLAQLTVRTPVGRALDLGTGCGVQALHLSTHAREVVATDVNPRALTMARLTATLSGIDVDVRDGSLFEPVAGEAFDLITTNPPFVVSPDGSERFTYRDSGMSGDDVVRTIVSEAPGMLNDGGWVQVLANWVHPRDTSWQDRLAAWIEPTGLDAWVLQREAADLPAYVEMWLDDAGIAGTAVYTQRYDEWLAWFEAEHIEAIGFGWLCLRKAGREQPVLQLEEWPFEIEQPLGPHVAAWGLHAGRVASMTDDELLAHHWTSAPDVVQEAVGPVGAADPEHLIVRLQRGVRRARTVDTIEAGLLGASDGDLSAGQVLDALATLLDHDPRDLRTGYAGAVRDLAREGFLLP